jgi:mRNA interferase RelE/StbE
MEEKKYPAQLLRRRQVEGLVGLRRSAIYAAIAAGRFPRPIHLGPRAVGWLASEVEAWIAGRVAELRTAAAAHASQGREADPAGQAQEATRPVTARYRVEVSKPAGKQIAGLDRTAQNRIIDRLTALGDNPRPAGSKKMAGPEAFWRIRVGDYRVVYSIEDARLVVLVLKIGHRREVYR